MRKSMSTYKEFAEKHRVTIESKFLGVKKDEGWEHLAFEVQLMQTSALDAESKCERCGLIVAVARAAGFTTPYKLGMASALPPEWRAGKMLLRQPDPKRAPKVEDVLSALAIDAGVIHHDSFESWAGDFGYDLDSRKAEKTYRACRDTAEKLTSWLGIDVLSELLSCTEE